MDTIGIDWRIGDQTGWEVFGAHLAQELLTLETNVRLLLSPDRSALPEVMRVALREVLEDSAPLWASAADELQVSARVEYPVLRAVGNGLDAGMALFVRPARRNIGVVFLENTALGPTAIANARNFERILAGSTWNAELLRAAGLQHVDVVLQGVDVTQFHPGPRRNRWPGRFVIFSGGKLEFRKGQDIVVAAFREFHRTHPDALLVACWHNAWPATIAGIESVGHVEGRPEVAGGRLNLEAWVTHNGIPEGAFADLGARRHIEMPDILRDCDVAVFPNRAEGGTNLVMMEAMACGVPVVASFNTGHRDVALQDHTFVLETQGRITSPVVEFGTDGWGESSVEEVVHQLEMAYTDSERRKACGERGAQFMRGMTWSQTAARVRDLVVVAGRP